MLEWVDKVQSGEREVLLPAGWTLPSYPVVIPSDSNVTLIGTPNSVVMVTENGQDAFVGKNPVGFTASGVRVGSLAERAGAAFRITPSRLTGNINLDVQVLGGLNNGKGSFRQGIVLDNCWSASITGRISGDPRDSTAESISQAKMEIGIDLGNCQTPYVDPRTTIENCGVGISGHGDIRQGDSEGVNLEPRWIINVGTGIRLIGGKFGEEYTPQATLRPRHIFFTENGIQLIGRAQATIADCFFRGSEQAKTPCAIHAVACPGLKLYGNTFSRSYVSLNAPKESYAVVLDQLSNALIFGNHIEKASSLGFFLSNSVEHVKVFGNVNDASPFPLLDYGKFNSVQ